MSSSTPPGLPGRTLDPRVRRVQQLRRSGAAGPHTGKARRDRGRERRAAVEASRRGE